MNDIINYLRGLTEMNQRISLPIIAVIGALLFSSYASAESQAQQKNTPSAEQPLQNQATGKIKGTISFKGIPLGKPGVTDALRKMCKSKKFNITNDRCSFVEDRIMMVLDYESLVNAFALVTLSSDKALTKVVIDSSTQEMLTLAKALEKKYGKPLKRNSIVKMEVGIKLDDGAFVVKEAEGTKLDKETFVWVDDQGSRIIVESIYSDYDKGGVTIERPSSVAAQDTVEKKVKEAGKSNP